MREKERKKRNVCLTCSITTSRDRKRTKRIDSMNRKIGWANLNKHTLEKISASIHRVFYASSQSSNSSIE